MEKEAGDDVPGRLGGQKIEEKGPRDIKAHYVIKLEWPLKGSVAYEEIK